MSRTFPLVKIPSSDLSAPKYTVYHSDVNSSVHTTNKKFVEKQKKSLDQVQKLEVLKSDHSIYIGKPTSENNKSHILWETIYRLNTDSDYKMDTKFPSFYDTIFGDLEYVIQFDGDISEAKNIQDSINFHPESDNFPLKEYKTKIYPGFIEYEPYLDMTKNDMFNSKQEIESVTLPDDQDGFFFRRLYFNYASKMENNESKTITNNNDDTFFVFLTSPIFCQTLFRPIFSETTKSHMFHPVTENDHHSVMCECSKKYDCLSVDINSSQNIAKFYSDNDYLEMCDKINRIFDPDNKPVNMEFIEEVQRVSDTISFFLKNSKNGHIFSKNTKKRDLVIVSNLFSTHFALSLSGCQKLLLETNSIKVIFLSDSVHPFNSFTEEKSFTREVLNACSDKDQNYQNNETSQLFYRQRFDMAKNFVTGLASVAVDRYNYLNKNKNKKDYDTLKYTKNLNQIKFESDDEETSLSESDDEHGSNTKSSSVIKNKSQYFGLEDDKSQISNLNTTKFEKTYYETRFSRIISGIVGSLAFVKFRQKSCRHINFCVNKMLMESILNDTQRIVNNMNLPFGKMEDLIQGALDTMENIFDSYENDIISVDSQENSVEKDYLDFENVAKLYSDKFKTNVKEIKLELKKKNSNISVDNLPVVSENNFKNIVTKELIEPPKYIIFGNVNFEDSEFFGSIFDKFSYAKLSLNIGIIECIEKPSYVFASILSSLDF